jgi:D-Tyr-tRNAtyr deacylase
MAPGRREMFDRFVVAAGPSIIVEQGVFGAEMMDSLVNWGRQILRTRPAFLNGPRRGGV